MHTAVSTQRSIRTAEDDDVRETVFRWQFDHNQSYQQSNANSYYFEVNEGNGDPSAGLLGRFAGNKPPVGRLSDCIAYGAQDVVDKKTGKTGVLFRVESIEWKSATEIEAKGGYYENGMSASGNTYTVKKVNGRWKVTKDKLDWIS